MKKKDEYRKEDYVCGINFDDPAQMNNGLKRIPIDQQWKFDDLRAAAIMTYEENDGLPWDADMDQQTERRVLDGMTKDQILAATKKDRDRKHNVPGEDEKK